MAGVGSILFVISLAYAALTLLTLSLFVLFIGIGMGVYHKVQKIETSGKRKTFFIASYLVALAMLIAGIAVFEYANTMVGWDALGVSVLGYFIAIIGGGLAISITGAIIACKIIARKKRC